jgi:antitoxin (DNA-binding transcriptional repressor) of toxin-antitoxin stability system
MTATEASRNFYAMLDAVESGETILLTRDGLVVGRFEPVHERVVDRLAEVFREYPADPGFGDHLEETVRDLRASMIEEDRECTPSSSLTPGSPGNRAEPST